MGTFMGARKYVRHTFATTQSATMKKRVARFMVGSVCPVCKGKRLKKEALSVTFAGLDIASLTALSLDRMAQVLGSAASRSGLSEEKRLAAQRLAQDLVERIATLQALGLGYLAMDRATPTLSPGELQRLRLATQIRSHLFGVVYVLDEPSAGLHPADSEALHDALDALRDAGNTIFVIEHDLDMLRRADWLVDVGPDAGQYGGRVLYSGTPEGLRAVAESRTARYLFEGHATATRTRRTPTRWLMLEHISRNNLHRLDARIPLGVFTAVTGVSGSGKSSLVSQALVDLVHAHLGHEPEVEEQDSDVPTLVVQTTGHIRAGAEHIGRLVNVDQKPIGRTPRSNLATYTGLFDHVRKLFAATKAAKARHYDAGRFPSTSPRAAAKPAKAKASSASNCSSCRACSHRAPPATARATTRRRWRSNGRGRTSRRCWA
jgi:excinuclease ABC subunit A